MLKSPPDGYTLCVLPSEPIIFNQFLFSRLPFNPEKDFEPVTNLFFNVEALVVNAQAKVKRSQTSLRWRRQNPNLVLRHVLFCPFRDSWKSSTSSTVSTSCAFLSAAEANNKPHHVRHGTHRPAWAEQHAYWQIRSGDIAGIALSANAQSPLIPDIPTLLEATGENYLVNWFGLFAPANTPRPIIEQVHADILQIASDPAFRHKNYVERAIEYRVNHDQFARFIVQSRAEAAKLVEKSGAQPQ